MRLRAFCPAVLVLSLCWLPGAATARVPNKAARADAVRAVVIRRIIATLSDGAERTYKAYYLEIGRGKDPGPDLVKRFHGNKPAVKPVSRSRINLKAKNPFLYAVEDRKTHLTGVIVRVGAVSWLAHRAKVHGGLYSGYRSGTESLYTVVRTRSGWTIESEGDAVKY